MNIENLTIEYHLVDSCNLKCAGCSHYASLLDKLTYTSLDDVVKDLKLLKSKIGDNLSTLRLLGGEPLLHPQICECLTVAREIFNKSNIIIVTNGILLEKMTDEFYNTCSRSNIQIMITDYKLLNICVVIDKLRKMNIATGVYRKSDKKFIWRYKHIRLTNDRIDCLSSCKFKSTCCSYRDGKIYLCAHIAYIDIFNKYFNKNVELEESDYISLNEINSYEELIEKLNSAKPNFCYQYCNYYGKSHPEVGKWCISKKDINEFCLL